MFVEWEWIYQKIIILSLRLFLIRCFGLRMALVLPILEIAGVATKLAGDRVCASGRVKVPETMVGRDSNRLRRLGISPLFPTPLLRVSSPPSPLLREKQESDGDGDKGDYYVNMGYAIRTLREELPEMFYREPCFDIYRCVISLRPFELRFVDCALFLEIFCIEVGFFILVYFIGF